jgi:hypothetical protein
LATAWTPAQLGASLALWLDADDASTIMLNGSTVSQWNDKSGNARNVLQATAANQPAYNTTGINSKPALVFDGVNDTLKSTANLGISGTQTFSIFAVHAFSWASARVALAFGTSGRYHHMASTASNQYWTGYDGGTQVATYTPSAPATPYMIGIERTGNTGASWNVFQNGSALALTAGNNVGVSLTNGPVSVGAYTDGTLAANLTAGEFIIVSGTLSTGDRQKLEGYLAWKWGLQANLPADHPYKTTPPTV